MAQQPLPPTPPLTAAGFADPTWQRWLEILRKRLSEAFSPGNPIPLDPSMVPGPDLTAVFFQLKKVAVISKKDAILKNLELTGTLKVDLTTHLVGNAQADGTLTVTGLVTATGAASVGTDLGVGHDLAVTHDATVGHNLGVTNDVGIGGNAGVTGALTCGMFGANGAAAQGSVAVNAAAVDLPTAIALLNQLRAVMAANGQVH